MKIENYKKLDKAVETVTWICAKYQHGENTLCFNIKTGVPIHQRLEVGVKKIIS